MAVGEKAAGRKRHFVAVVLVAMADTLLDFFLSIIVNSGVYYGEEPRWSDIPGDSVCVALLVKLCVVNFQSPVCVTPI